MLNTRQGVTPHAFLPGQPPMPKSMRDLSPNTFSLYAANHIHNSPKMTSPFSSWSPDLGTALYFATGQFGGHNWDGVAGNIDPRSCFIAVLDTWTMYTDEERPYHIVPVAMIGQPSCGCEYLVYGPVRGPAYTVVSMADIQEAVGCPYWPYCSTRRPMPHPFSPGELQEALSMSRLFNRSKAMQLTVFLAENCRQQWASPNPGQRDDTLGPPQWRRGGLNWDQSFEDISKLMVFLSTRAELVSYKDTLPLFNKDTDSLGMGQLQLALSLMAVTAELLESGFESDKLVLAEDVNQIMEPFLRPQRHIHNCEDPERRFTMSIEGHYYYRAGFLNLL